MTRRTSTKDQTLAPVPVSARATNPLWWLAQRIAERAPHTATRKRADVNVFVRRQLSSLLLVATGGGILFAIAFLMAASAVTDTHWSLMLRLVAYGSAGWSTLAIVGVRWALRDLSAPVAIDRASSAETLALVTILTFPIASALGWLLFH